MSAAERDRAVQQLRELTKKLQCYSETFARAVSILDAFLLMMKVKPLKCSISSFCCYMFSHKCFVIAFIWILLKVKVKFLNCLTVTCFFIAAKLEEDIEVRVDHVMIT